MATHSILLAFWTWLSQQPEQLPLNYKNENPSGYQNSTGLVNSVETLRRSDYIPGIIPSCESIDTISQ